MKMVFTSSPRDGQQQQAVFIFHVQAADPRAKETKQRRMYDSTSPKGRRMAGEGAKFNVFNEQLEYFAGWAAVLVKRQHQLLISLVLQLPFSTWFLMQDGFTGVPCPVLDQAWLPELRSEV